MLIFLKMKLFSANDTYLKWKNLPAEVLAHLKPHKKKKHIQMYIKKEFNKFISDKLVCRHGST